VTVQKVGMSVVDVDLNHPMAGKDLHFDVEIVDVREAGKEELTTATSTATAVTSTDRSAIVMAATARFGGPLRFWNTPRPSMVRGPAA
jgi:FKBP-type peptidyl-prolyl cis-trans isomerase 2